MVWGYREWSRVTGSGLELQGGVWGYREGSGVTGRGLGLQGGV